MSIAKLCQTFRTHWEAWTHYFWPESATLRVQAERARLTEELRRRYQRLLRRRRKIERLRDRLEVQERAGIRLTARVQACVGKADGQDAWDAALDLDRLRRAAGRTRQRLRRQELAYERQRLHFERRKQQARSLGNQTI
jgi:hypothetical protein